MEGSSKKCEDLRKVVKDVVGFGDGEVLRDLSLTLVDRLKNLSLTLVDSLNALPSEHVNLLCREICLKQIK